MAHSNEFPYFVIEHHENRDFPQNGWCAIEYLNILRVATPSRVIITNMTKENQLKLHPEFQLCAAITHHTITDYVYNKDGINDDPNTPQVLKDLYTFHHNNVPKTTTTASTEDTNPSTSSPSTTTVDTTTTIPLKESQICFLDEFGTGPLEPTDLGKFQYIIVGGILGDHPSTDRGGHLRAHFPVRHLGERQLSTDTAVVACSVVLRHGIQIDQLEYLDDPEVYEDEIDKIPLIEQIAIGQAKKKQLRKMRESTAIRMRYFTHQQQHLDNTPLQQPRDIICIDRSSTTTTNTNTTVQQHPMTQFPCFCDCDLCTQQRQETNTQCCQINHAGDWYHSRPKVQNQLYTQTQTRIARITPGLLDHIFSTLDDGLIDLDGQLDIDFEAMALGIDEAEDQELCKILFFD